MGEGFFEELRDEWGGERHYEDFVLAGSFFCQRHRGIGGDCEVVAADEVDFGLFDKFPNGGGFEVRDFVLVCGGKVGAPEVSGVSIFSFKRTWVS